MNQRMAQHIFDRLKQVRVVPVDPNSQIAHALMKALGEEVPEAQASEDQAQKPVDQALITMDKQYVARNGQKVRVLAVDAEGNLPVIYQIVDTANKAIVLANKYGQGPQYASGQWDLVEVEAVTYQRFVNTGNVYKSVEEIPGLGEGEPVLKVIWRGGTTPVGVEMVQR